MLVEILFKILSIFLLVGMGLFAHKVHLVPDDAVRTLNAFVLNVAMTCLVLHSMQRDELNDKVMGDVLWALGVFSLVTILIAVLSSLLIRPIKSIPEEDKGIYKMQLAFTNAGFMGFPLTSVLFGKYALFLAIVINIAFSVLSYSLGAFLLVHKKGEKIFTLKLLVRILNLPFIASLVGLFIFITGFHFPSFINDTLGLMEASVSPVAMFVVGLNLSRSKLKDLFTKPNMILCFFSLIVIPAMTLGIDLLLPVSNIVLVTHVFLMAMPSAAVTTILCHRYDKNAKLSAEGVASTTLISLGTLSAWAFILTEFFL